MILRLENNVGLRILLADDHTVVRQGLRRILEGRPDWHVVAEAGDGRQAIRLAEEHAPDVAVIDVAMPLLNGVEVTRHIVRGVPRTRVLVLSMHSDETYVTQILKAGARGYLLKESADTDLLQAVNAVADGGCFFSPSVAGMMLDDYVHHRQPDAIDRYESLFEREREDCRTCGDRDSFSPGDRIVATTTWENERAET